MSGFGVEVPEHPPNPGDAETPLGRGVATWIFLLAHLMLGVTALGFALSSDLAHGRAAFASNVWRVPLGLAGAFLAYRALRAIVRMGSGGVIRISPELRHRARINGWVLVLIGAGFLIAALSEALGADSVHFTSWARPFFVAGGIYLILWGLSQQWDPTRSLRRQRIERGEGIPATARILRANDTGVSVNDAPQVKIDFAIDLDGQTYEASDKIVMQRAKLALLIPGATVPVLVDREDRSLFHVDWDGWQAPGTTPATELAKP